MKFGPKSATAIVFAILYVSAGQSIAQEKRIAQGSGAADNENKGLAELVELSLNLDSDEFAVRRQAAIRLSELGETAVPKLVEIVKHWDREAALRAFEILKRHAVRGTPELKSRAKDAFAELLQHPNKGIVQSARRILNQMRPLDEQLSIGNNASLKRLVSRSGKGVRTTDVEDNKRKIHLQEFEDGKISIEVKELNGETESVKKYEAESSEDLKKENEEAFRIYQLFGKPKGFEALGNNTRNERLNQIQMLLNYQRSLSIKRQRILDQMKALQPPAQLSALQQEFQQLSDRLRQIDTMIQERRGVIPENGQGLPDNRNG